MDTYLKEVESFFIKHGCIETAVSMKEDKRSNLAFIGIRMLQLRPLSNTKFSFYNQDEEKICKIWTYIWENSSFFEVKTVACLFYSKKKFKIKEARWKYIKTWINQADNWDLADHLAKIYSFLLPLNFQEIYPSIKKWNTSSDLWKKRISITCLIRYTGKNAVYLEPNFVLPLVENCLSDERYYIQKAVGWVLREVGKKYEEEVIGFIDFNLGKLSAIAYGRAKAFLPKELSNHFKLKRKMLKSNIT